MIADSNRYEQLSYSVRLDSKDMWGNPYNFANYFEQQLIYDISEIGMITQMRLYFYQEGNFINHEKEPLEYTIPGTNELLPDNLFIKNIFEPLGMKDTGFFVPKEKQERLARAYNSDGVRFSEYTGENLLIQSRMEEQPKFESGGAGLVSTIDDYSKICQMFLNNGELGGHRILHPETIRFMSQGSLNEAQRSCIGGWNYLNGYTYGNLLRILKYPGEAVSLGVKGEFGWDGWLGVYVSIIPEYDMYILYMQQKPDTGTTDVVNKIRNVIFSSIM